MKKRLLKKIISDKLCPNCKKSTVNKKYRQLDPHDKDRSYYDSDIHATVEYHIHCKYCGFLLIEMSYSKPISVWDMVNGNFVLDY